METVMNYFDSLMKESPEWRQAFIDLAKAYKEADPESRRRALDMLKEANKKRSQNIQDR